MEESENEKILETVDGTFVDDNISIETQEIPEISEDDLNNREYEIIEDGEGGL